VKRELWFTAGNKKKRFRDVVEFNPGKLARGFLQCTWHGTNHMSLCYIRDLLEILLKREIELRQGRILSGPSTCML
jgi:hypothetical protein